MGKPTSTAEAKPRPTVAEFFAGIGLVRLALERAGCDIVFANDISEFKRDMYARNFGPDHFLLKDVRKIQGSEVPQVDIATASFPCTDTSLAGGRAGLAGEHSSLLWEFVRILTEMGSRRPRVVMLENVAGFASSNQGEDLRATIDALKELGYHLEVKQLDAAQFLPQSRRRIFIIGSLDLGVALSPNLPAPPVHAKTLADIVERLPEDSESWWPDKKVEAFFGSMSRLQRDRLEALALQPVKTWVTAYRRTRGGIPMWEARSDSISGCLRTARGGSSRQAIVEAGNDEIRVRWMTGREYARLMGAPDYDFGDATESQAKFAMGDAVCVPVVEWLAKHYLVPLALEGQADGGLPKETSLVQGIASALSRFQRAIVGNFSTAG